MRSSFFGLNVGVQGLYTAQTALNVTNHNISNAETKGYSRQTAEISATRALPNNRRGMVGTGAEVTNVVQSRNAYIDSKYWSMSQDLGQYTIKNDMLGQLEILFNEPSDTGYNAMMGDLFSSIQTLSLNPPEDALVSGFVDSADSFAQYFNNLGKQLMNTQKEANFGVKATVTQINNISSQIGALNDQIGNLELGGARANDLRDERANLLDSLSALINIETKETTDINGKNTFSVTIGGQMLVRGNQVNQLELVPRTTLNNPEDVPDMFDIYWESGQKLYLNSETSSGELVGYLDVRDGNNGENFKGTITNNLAGPPQQIVVNNLSRNDIMAAGKIVAGNREYEYSAMSFDEISGEMTFTLTAAAPELIAGINLETGEQVDFKGIPYYVQKLNEFVRTMAKEFNQIHKAGNGGADPKELFQFKGYTGAPPQMALDEANLFTYNQITIHNFAFSEEIINDNSLLETSFVSDAGESANDLLLALFNIKQDVDVFSKGKPDSFMQAMISELAIDTKKSESFKTGQENLTRLVDNQRKSVSSVDLNEETADMLRFQQAYNFSAKIISVMDEIYDVTINQLKR